MLTPPSALSALLFASGEPLSKKEVISLLDITPDQLVTVLATLKESLVGSGLAIIETETELEMRTAPEASDIVKKLRESEFARDLGKGSLETLAIIAYRDGATRSEIDWVRGVNSTASLRTLLMRGLINGHEDETDKRKIRYTITTEALAHLGVSCAEDLPRSKELSDSMRTTSEDIALATNQVE